MFSFIADWRNLRKTARRRGAEAFRPGTRSNVCSAVLLYVAFTLHFSLTDFPAAAGTLVIFGEFLLRSYRAPKSVFNALASLRHFHLDRNLPLEAFESRKVSLWKRAVASTVRHVPRPAPPLPQGVLGQLCELALQLGPLGLLFAVLASVIFSSMARLSSLLPKQGERFDSTRLPTWGDLVRDGMGWRLKIKWAKAHQGADQAFEVPLLPVKGSAACPVANLARLSCVVRSPELSDPLFGFPGSVQGSGARVLTMRVAREWLKVLLARLGLQDCGYTFHSFRRGACTRAFRRGAKVADIQLLGGWRSDAVRAYLPLDEARRRAALALTE